MSSSTVHNFDLGHRTGRVVRIPNHKYKKNGTKSYVHALMKYHITPTKPGPFYMGARQHHQGVLGNARARVGGRKVMHNVLMKHAYSADGGAATGMVTAEDVQNDSEYLCPVYIGTPAQKVMLDFDTGSADLWVWSTELPRRMLFAHAKDHTIFDPKHSSTFARMHGSRWQIQYGDDSTAYGDVGLDNVQLGGITVHRQAVELAEDLSSQFAQGEGDGLLGLAFSKINTVQPARVRSPVDNMISQSSLSAGNHLFTAYLGSYKDDNEADKGESFYTFGHIDADALSWHKVGLHDIHYTPVDTTNGFWEFPSTSAKVGMRVVHLGASNTAIADTGTTLCLVSDELCEAIYREIKGARYDDTVQGWVFPMNTGASGLPTVQVQVGDNFYYIHKEDLAYADAGNGYVYGGVQSRGDLPLDIFGDTFLKGVYAIFDVGNKAFGAVQRLEEFQNIATKVKTEEKKANDAKAEAPKSKEEVKEVVKEEKQDAKDAHEAPPPPPPAEKTETKEVVTEEKK